MSDPKVCQALQSFVTPRNRSAPTYAATIGIFLAVALSLRYMPRAPGWFNKWGGDAFWASTAFFCCALLLPRLSTARVAFGAAVFSMAIEFSQLYQSPWLNAIRRTLPGAWILGSGFAWKDLVYYGEGILIAVSFDLWLLRKNEHTR